MKDNTKILLKSSILGAIIVLVTVLFFRQNWLLFFILIPLAYLMLNIKPDKREFKFFLFCGFFGSLAEMISIYIGVWEYSNPNFINIPVWLFILWGIASIYILRMGDFFKSLK